jgi:hypothetical protein
LDVGLPATTLKKSQPVRSIMDTRNRKSIVFLI